jgi:hypothetical protein
MQPPAGRLYGCACCGGAQYRLINSRRYPASQSSEIIWYADVAITFLTIKILRLRMFIYDKSASDIHSIELANLFASRVAHIQIE